MLTTFAGNDWVFPGDAKPAVNAPLGQLFGLTLDRAGNPIIVDNDNCLVARVEKNGVLTVIAGNGICGLSFVISGDGGPATAAGVFSPYSAAFDPAGNLYISNDSLIRKVSGGMISLFAGNESFKNGSAHLHARFHRERSCDDRLSAARTRRHHFHLRVPAGRRHACRQHAPFADSTRQYAGIDHRPTDPVVVR